MKLNQTTYRLWLRDAINQTGYADDAIQLYVDSLQPIPVTPNQKDTQD